MSDHENQRQPLVRAASQQTGMGEGPPGQGARSTRAYKVAGLTLVACVLIVGQAAVTYLVLSQRSDIKSLQDQNNQMRNDLTKPRSVSVPMRMQAPGLTMLDFNLDALEEESSTGPREKAAGPLTSCQLEEAGQKPTQMPLFRPSCDGKGLYRSMQCFRKECWCVNPETGELIPGSVKTGAASCRPTVGQRMGKFVPNMLLTEKTVVPNAD